MLQLNPDLADLVSDAAAGLAERLQAKATITAGCANGGTEARITSAISEEVVILDLNQAQQPGEPKWANYLRGVIRGFQDRGHHIPGFDAYILSSVPGGAGLSSSA